MIFDLPVVMFAPCAGLIMEDGFFPFVFAVIRGG
jgi:hypothetical protein